MRSSHNLSKVETTFDDDNVVPHAGLQAPAALAQRLGVGELIDKRVKLPADAAGRANSGIKALTVVGAMLAGGDSIDDTDVLRSGAAPEVFTATRAPSTVGTWLRGFNWAAVRMLDAVGRIVLARAWEGGSGSGPGRRVDHRRGLHDLPDLRHRQAGRQVRLHQGARLSPAAGDAGRPMITHHETVRSARFLSEDERGHVGRLCGLGATDHVRPGRAATPSCA